MPVIIRLIFVIFCGYAGSAVAEAQFSDLPEDSHEMAQK